MHAIWKRLNWELYLAVAILIFGNSRYRMHASSEITVIGAGIVGASVATHLQRAGRQVTLLDATGIGEGCSYGNAGGISPGAIVPAATPNLLWDVPRWLLNPQGPLSLRWRYLPQALPWLLKWVAEGTPTRRRHNAQALASLNQKSYDGYRWLLDRQQHCDLIRECGQLTVWRQGIPPDSVAREMRERLGVEAHALDARELSSVQPGLSTEYTRGVLFPGNGFTVNPQRLVHTITQNFQAAGGTFHRAKVLDFEQGPEGPKALLTDRGSIAVQRLVIATGAWSAQLVSRLGVKIPMEAERGYHLTIYGAQSPLLHPVLDAEQRIMLTPMEFGLRIAGTVEFAGVDAAPDFARSAMLKQQAARVLQTLPQGQESHWMGMRPSMPDSLPVIDRHPAFNNVFFAFGHGHQGLSGAPETGRLVADLLLGRTPTIDPTPFRHSRFGP